MTQHDRMTLVQSVRQRYDTITPFLTEPVRRVWAAAEALAIGRRGNAIVAEATGISRTTLTKAKQELSQPPLAEPRQRQAGGGRKKLTDTDPSLLRDLDQLIDPFTRGDPESPLRWTCKSTYHLAEALQQRGHRICQRTVYNLLVDLQYSLQANRKTEEGKDHPDRDAQFRFLSRKVQRFQQRQQPVISVDTKKKENIGNYGNPGREWGRPYQPRRVQTHDFREKGEAKACPYGIYDVTENEGWVNVGISHDTAQFAVASIRGWWRKMGAERYPHADALFITADAGGSNSYRIRLWKREIQQLANELRLAIHVSHFPPGTSKWNQIEHRMFSFISKNWRGRPLDSLATIVNLIAQTTTGTGLYVEASLDFAIYPDKVEVSDEEMASLNIKREKFHGEWNYILRPQ